MRRFIIFISIVVSVLGASEAIGHEFEIGKTRRSFTQLFSKVDPKVVFKESTLADGGPQIISHTKELNLFIQIIGPSWGSVEKVSMTWMRPEHTPLALMILKHIFPERKTGYTVWLHRAIEAKRALDIRRGILTTFTSSQFAEGLAFSLYIQPVPDSYTFYNK